MRMIEILVSAQNAFVQDVNVTIRKPSFGCAHSSIASSEVVAYIWHLNTIRQR